MSHLNRKRSPAIDAFFHAILTLQSIDECYLFFSDLCTVQELTSMVQRLQAASLLAEGNTYKTVQEQIGISSSTITRINTELCYGAGGYHLVLDRLNRSEEALSPEPSGFSEPDSASGKTADQNSDDKAGKNAATTSSELSGEQPPHG